MSKIFKIEHKLTEKTLIVFFAHPLVRVKANQSKHDLILSETFIEKKIVRQDTVCIGHTAAIVCNGLYWTHTKWCAVSS